MLIKALVRAESFDKALALKLQMECDGVHPDIATFNELLIGSAQLGSFDDGFSLLEEIEAHGLKPNLLTLQATARLVDCSRKFEKVQEHGDVANRISKLFATQGGELCYHGLALDYKSSGPWPFPALASTLRRAKTAMPSACLHEISVTGRLAYIKNVRKTLKQHGFLDREEDGSWPLDGHWETEHGLTVVIERSLVRWSRHRASKLKVLGSDRRSCALHLYGVSSKGHVVAPGLAPGATKTLRWDNGDVWHSYSNRIIGQATLLSQSMTKISRDRMRDDFHQAKAQAVLKCTSIDSFPLDTSLLFLVIQFIGSDSYQLKVQFQSIGYLSLPVCGEVDDGDILCSLSRRHPRVGFRHCWAECNVSVGQRTLVNGEEVNEISFRSHIQGA
jgi:pentatricopeptide repeat protein